jgi:2-oxoglutarate dehydrogenase E1 component
VVVDIVGYRRNGHNELDDPRVTLPLTYSIIQHHPPVLETYSAKLQVGVMGVRQVVVVGCGGSAETARRPAP